MKSYKHCNLGDEELQALQLRVFTNMDIEEGETTIVDSVEVTDWELIIEV